MRKSIHTYACIHMLTRAVARRYKHTQIRTKTTYPLDSETGEKERGKHRSVRRDLRPKRRAKET